MQPAQLGQGDDDLAAWASDAPTPTLEGISLSVRKSELVGVYGRVGAGKTSLASAIIGDMHRREGTVSVRGTIAYASQNPWIMSATVRDNILFSHEYDETFYNLVLDGELGYVSARMEGYLMHVCSVRFTAGLGAYAAGRSDGGRREGHYHEWRAACAPLACESGVRPR